MRGILEYLAANPYDILCLQELWISGDFERLRDALQPIYPHTRYYDGGLIGSGLAIFSRYEVVSTKFHIFNTNGSPWRLSHGDWYSGKGIALVVVRVDRILVACFNMHLHAEYGKSRASRLGTRIVQLWEARRWMDALCCNYHAVVVCGDLNTCPDELPYQAFFQEDFGCARHLYDPGLDYTETAPETLFTYGMPENEWSGGKRGKRLDYILSHNMDCRAYHVINPKKDGLSLSDHALIVAELEPGPDHFCNYAIQSTEEYMLKALLSHLKKDCRKRKRQATTFFLIWLFLTLSSIGFGAYSFVTVYIPHYPKTISLMLYIFFPIVVLVSDYFFFLWLFARGDAKVYERTISEIQE